MLRKEILLASCAIMALSYTVPVKALEWSDNKASVWFQTGVSYPSPNNTPGANSKTNNTVIEYTHTDGYEYGTNFFSIDYLISSGGVKSDGTPFGNPASSQSNNGASEAYIVYRNSLSFNKIGDTKMFSFGPIRDVAFDIGGDLEVSNTQFGPAKQLVVLGPSLAFNVPGFWNIAILGNKECNNNGFFPNGTAGTPGVGLSYNVAVMFASSWGIPFSFGHDLSFAFNGYGSINSPKGSPSGIPTATEYMIHTTLMYDLGEVMNNPNKLFLGIGYEGWINKYGNSPTGNPVAAVGPTAGGKLAGTTQNSPLVALDFHF